MNRDYLLSEAYGVSMRVQSDMDDIMDAEERRRQGERRRATDEADGYVEPLEDGED